MGAGRLSLSTKVLLIFLFFSYFIIQNFLFFLFFQSWTSYFPIFLSNHVTGHPGPYSRIVINAHTKARFWTSSHQLPTIYSCGHDNSATDHSCFGIFFAYYKYLKINYFNFSSSCEAILTYNKQKERCGCAKTQTKKVISIIKNRFTFTCS